MSCLCSATWSSNEKTWTTMTWKVKVKPPSLWVGWVCGLPLPSKTDMDKSRKQYLRNEGRQNRVHQCVVHLYKIQKPNLCCQMSDDGNFCKESNDGQVSGVLSVICYLIWVLITQVCSLCEFHPRVPDGALFFFFFLLESPASVRCSKNLNF